MNGPFWSIGIPFASVAESLSYKSCSNFDNPQFNSITTSLNKFIVKPRIFEPTSTYFYLGTERIHRQTVWKDSEVRVFNLVE